MKHSLQRTVRIRASRETVFRFFTDPARWARWWGEGSSIDARPGGAVVVRYPGGIEASGEVIESEPPERLVFTYGYASGNPIPPGASRVSIRLFDEGGATRLELTHEFDDPAVRDQHVQGCRFQLSLFANAVAAEAFAGVEAVADQWFAAWIEPDPAARRAAFEAIADPAVTFRDRYSALERIDDLVEHAGAAQRFVPGVRLARRGEVRQCQGMAIVSWAASGPDGTERGRGHNVFEFGGDGRVIAVTGFAE
jgi:uncharacterized protein YndB with AHSA1/START domain